MTARNGIRVDRISGVLCCDSVSNYHYNEWEVPTLHDV